MTKAAMSPMTLAMFISKTRSSNIMARAPDLVYIVPIVVLAMGSDKLHDIHPTLLH